MRKTSFITIVLLASIGFAETGCGNVTDAHGSAVLLEGLDGLVCTIVPTREKDGEIRADVAKVIAEAFGNEIWTEISLARDVEIYNRPDELSPVLGNQEKGEKILFIQMSEREGWCKINYNGRVAYIPISALEQVETLPMPLPTSTPVPTILPSLEPTMTIDGIASSASTAPSNVKTPSASAFTPPVEETPSPPPVEETPSPPPVEETPSPTPVEETPSPTPEPEETPSPTPKPEETSSPTPEPEETPSPTPEPEETPSPTPELEETPSPTPKPEETPSSTPNAEETGVSSQTPDTEETSAS